VGNEEYEGALLNPSISGEAAAIKGPAYFGRGYVKEQRDQVSGKRRAWRGFQACELLAQPQPEEPGRVESGGLALAGDADPADGLANLPLLLRDSLGRNREVNSSLCRGEAEGFTTSFSPAETPFPSKVSGPAQHQHCWPGQQDIHWGPGFDVPLSHQRSFSLALPWLG